MFKTVIKSALAASLAAGGLIALSSGVASAAAVTVTAGAGSSLSCGLNATAKLDPALKNGWTQTTTDTIPAVNNLPTTSFASPGPVSIASKGSGTGCTGTAVQGANTTSITSYKLVTTAVPGTGSTDPASCANLISDSASSTQKFDSTIKWTGSPLKIAPTTITNQGLSVSYVSGRVRVQWRHHHRILRRRQPQRHRRSEFRSHRGGHPAAGDRLGGSGRFLHLARM